MSVDRRRGELERDQQPRTFSTEGRRNFEPQLSKADEDRIAKRASDRQNVERRAYVVELLDGMQTDLDRLQTLMPRVVAGVDHKHNLRAIANGLKGLRRLVGE